MLFRSERWADRPPRERVAPQRAGARRRRQTGGPLPGTDPNGPTRLGKRSSVAALAACCYTVFMIRTQVQLDEDLYEALRRKAFTERKSIAATVRAILARALGRPSHGGRKRRDRFTFVGAVRGKAKDVSVRHDDYLGKGPRW